MKTICFRTVIVVVIFALVGCGSDDGQVAELPLTGSVPAAAINTTATALSASVAGGTASTTGAADQVETFRNPFAPPKDPPPPPIVEEPEPEPETIVNSTPEVRQPGTPPKIRLLGFLNSGEPKILVAYRKDLETLAIGDTLEDMKVVRIESPDVTMLFENHEITLSLFDQEWQHEGEVGSGTNSNRYPSRPRATRPTRNTSIPSSNGSSAPNVAPAPNNSAGGPTRAPSSIPGFAPNAGKPPGFEPPGLSGGSLTPRDPIGSPPPGLPGLGTDASGGAGINNNLPTIPGLDLGGSNFGLPTGQ